MKTTTTYRQKDSGWQIIVSWKDTSGHWHQKSKQGFARKTDAKGYEQTLLREIKNRPQPVIQGMAGITLKEFTDEYINNRNDLAYGTKRIYRHAVESLQDIAKKPVHTITYLDLQKAVSAWTMKPQTQKEYRAKLNLIFRSAVKPYGLINYNPVPDIEIKKERKRRLVATVPEKKFWDIVGSVRRADTRLALYIAWYTGMRKGEVVALEWQDISFTAATVTVRHQLASTEKHLAIVDTLKSRNGYRTIPIPQELVRELRAYRRDYPININGNIFAYPAAVYSDIGRVMQRHGSRPHYIRHTYATRLLAKGIDVQTVAALIGDNVQTVISTYIHYSDEMRKAAAGNIEKIFAQNF